MFAIPKATFFSLSGKKRQEIINVAVAEFASFPYEKASLSKIVQAAKIAKGSMYQYFENKRELYLYIVKIAYEKKHYYLHNVFKESNDFLKTLKLYYKKSYLFAREFPNYHRIISIYWDNYNPEFGKILKETKELRAEMFINMLDKAMKSGLVNRTISHEAAFFVYHSVGKELIDDFLDLPTKDAKQHLQYIDDVLDVLALGLASRKE